MSGIYNPSPQRVPPPQAPQYATRGDKLVVVMVGLPARGKSYIASRLSQYISFFYGSPCKVFNVSNYRREMAGAYQPASFFEDSNADALALRIKVRVEAAEAGARNHGGHPACPHPTPPWAPRSLARLARRRETRRWPT